jgi:hypothetical protein
MVLWDHGITIDVKGDHLTWCHVMTILPRTMKGEPKESEKVQVGVRLDAALLVEVKVLAVRQGRRLNDLVEEALRDILKKHKVRY